MLSKREKLRKQIQIILSLLLCCIMIINDSMHIGIKNYCFLVVLNLYIIYVCNAIFKNEVYFDLLDFFILLYGLILIAFNADTNLVNLLCLYLVLRTANVSIRIWVIFFALVGIFESVIVILQYCEILTSNNNYFRMTGTFLNPGPCACFLNIIGVVSFIYLHSYLPFNVKHFISKIDLLHYSFFIVTLIFIIISLLLLNSRTSFLAFFVTILIYIVKTAFAHGKLIYLKKRKFLFCILIGCILLVFIYLLYIIRPLSADSRLLIWRISIIIIKKYFIFGAGPNTFRYQFAKAQESFFQNEANVEYVKYADIPEYAFNEYIEFISEYGFIRLFIVIYFILQIMKNQKNIVRYGIINVSILSITSYPLHILSIQILFIIFLSLRENTAEDAFNRICRIVIIFYFIFQLHVSSISFKKNIITMEWERQYKMSKSTFVEIRDINEYQKIYSYIYDNNDFLLDYGFLLYKNKRYDKSIQILSEGVQISNDPIFLILIGMNYEKKHKYDLAESFYKEAFNRVPNRIHPLYRMALLYYKIKDKERFDTVAKKIMNFEPKIESEITRKMKDEVIDLVTKEVKT